MNNTTKLLLIVIINFILVACMLYWLHKSGIDLQDSTLADNASNMAFTFDLIAFMIVSFAANIGIMSYPSRKKQSLKKLITRIEVK